MCVDTVSLGKVARSTTSTRWPLRASSIAVGGPRSVRQYDGVIGHVHEGSVQQKPWLDFMLRWRIRRFCHGGVFGHAPKP